MINSTVTFDIEKLHADIENGTLKLPPMPDWVFKIQRMLDDMNVSTDKIVATVSRDPTFVAQLFKSANSAAYAGKPKVNTAKAAISRIGFKALRNLVIAISMNNLSKTNNPTVGKFLSKFWEHSREVAAISYLLSKSQPHLNQDQAMLAGLIHDIGTLPLCINAGKRFPNINESDLSLIVRNYSAQVSEKMLQEWGFPLEMSVIPNAHENLQIQNEGNLSNYADIITIANLLNRVTAKTVNWESITAVQRLGLDVQIYQDFFERFESDIVSARSMLEV
jgi:HD-like signal output (HDOD) protein